MSINNDILDAINNSNMTETEKLEAINKLMQSDTEEKKMEDNKTFAEKGYKFVKTHTGKVIKVTADKADSMVAMGVIGASHVSNFVIDNGNAVIDIVKDETNAVKDIAIEATPESVKGAIGKAIETLGLEDKRTRRWIYLFLAIILGVLALGLAKINVGLIDLVIAMALFFICIPMIVLLFAGLMDVQAFKFIQAMCKVDSLRAIKNGDYDKLHDTLVTNAK